MTKITVATSNMAVLLKNIACGDYFEFGKDLYRKDFHKEGTCYCINLNRIYSGELRGDLQVYPKAPKVSTLS